MDLQENATSDEPRHQATGIPIQGEGDRDVVMDGVVPAALLALRLGHWQPALEDEDEAAAAPRSQPLAGTGIPAPDLPRPNEEPYSPPSTVAVGGAGPDDGFRLDEGDVEHEPEPEREGKPEGVPAGGHVDAVMVEGGEGPAMDMDVGDQPPGVPVAQLAAGDQPAQGVAGPPTVLDPRVLEPLLHMDPDLFPLLLALTRQTYAGTGDMEGPLRAFLKQENAPPMAARMCTEVSPGMRTDSEAGRKHLDRFKQLLACTPPDKWDQRYEGKSALVYAVTLAKPAYLRALLAPEGSTGCVRVDLSQAIHTQRSTNRYNLYAWMAGKDPAERIAYKECMELLGPYYHPFDLQRKVPSFAVLPPGADASTAHLEKRGLPGPTLIDKTLLYKACNAGDEVTVAAMVGKVPAPFYEMAPSTHVVGFRDLLSQVNSGATGIGSRSACLAKLANHAACDPAATDSHGSVLFAAAEHEHYDVVKHMLRDHPQRCAQVAALQVAGTDRHKKNNHTVFTIQCKAMQKEKSQQVKAQIEETLVSLAALQGHHPGALGGEGLTFAFWAIMAGADVARIWPHQQMRDADIAAHMYWAQYVLGACGPEASTAKEWLRSKAAVLAQLSPDTLIEGSTLAAPILYWAVLAQDVRVVTAWMREQQSAASAAMGRTVQGAPLMTALLLNTPSNPLLRSLARLPGCNPAGKDIEGLTVFQHALAKQQWPSLAIWLSEKRIGAEELAALRLPMASGRSANALQYTCEELRVQIKKGDNKSYLQGCCADMKQCVLLLVKSGAFLFGDIDEHTGLTNVSSVTIVGLAEAVIYWEENHYEALSQAVCAYDAILEANRKHPSAVHVRVYTSPISLGTNTAVTTNLPLPVREGARKIVSTFAGLDSFKPGAVTGWFGSNVCALAWLGLASAVEAVLPRCSREHLHPVVQGYRPWSAFQASIRFGQQQTPWITESIATAKLLLQSPHVDVSYKGGEELSGTLHMTVDTGPEGVELLELALQKLHGMPEDSQRHILNSTLFKGQPDGTPFIIGCSRVRQWRSTAAGGTDQLKRYVACVEELGCHPLNDLSVRDMHDDTPLIKAAWSGLTTVVKAMVAREQCTPDVLNAQAKAGGHTALIACSYAYSDSTLPAQLRAQACACADIIARSLGFSPGVTHKTDTCGSVMQLAYAAEMVQPTTFKAILAHPEVPALIARPSRTVVTATSIAFHQSLLQQLAWLWSKGKKVGPDIEEEYKARLKTCAEMIVSHPSCPSAEVQAVARNPEFAGFLPASLVAAIGAGMGDATAASSTRPGARKRARAAKEPSQNKSARLEGSHSPSSSAGAGSGGAGAGSSALALAGTGAGGPEAEEQGSSEEDSEEMEQ